MIAYGYSQGGYNVTYQLAQYDCWDAGMAVNGVLNIEQWAQVDDGHSNLKQVLGEPGKNSKQYSEDNPATYAASITSPLLIIHGAEDAIVPIEVAESFVKQLQEAGRVEGKDFVFTRMEGVGYMQQEWSQVWTQMLSFLESRF